MNKYRIITGLLAVLALAGCQTRELDVRAPEGKAFVATIEDGFVGTKTSMDGEGNVLWKKGDQISIFVGSTINEQYQVTDSSDGKTSASLQPVSSPGFVAGGEIPANVAFYPYCSTNEIEKTASGYVLSGFELPSAQNYAADSFGNGAFPMVAVTASQSDMKLKFRNILGGIKLQLKGTAKIVSVSIEGNADEAICGAAEVTASSASVPAISLKDASAKKVTLDCGEGVQLNETTATSFVIALPAMTMSGGFTFVVKDDEGRQMEIKSTKSQTIKRSDLLKMPVVTYSGTDLLGDQKGYLTSSAIGIYNPDDAEAEYAFDKYSDQLVKVVDAHNSFRMQNLNQAKYFELYDIPTSYSVGSSFNARVLQNYVETVDENYFETVAVEKIADGLAWLKGDKKCYIIRQ